MAQIKADEITQLLKEQIQNYDAEIRVDEVGTIISLGDGIARIHGLDKAMAGEMLKFPHGVEGLAMNLDEDQVGCVILGDYTILREGDEVKRSGEIMSVPVGNSLMAAWLTRLASQSITVVPSRGPSCCPSSASLRASSTGRALRSPCQPASRRSTA